MGPDVGIGEDEVSWIVEEFDKQDVKGPRQKITGKPIDLGGIPERELSTGHGVAIVAEQIIKQLKLDRKSIEVCIQGFGNVGQFAAKTLSSNGFKVIGVSDSQASIYSPKELNIEKLIHYKSSNKSLKGFTDDNETEELERDKILYIDADILIPAALENIITKDNAGDINASIIVEGSNSPITFEADQILRKRGIKVVPDILANSGGVLTSFAEWHLNKSDSSSIDNLKEHITHKLSNLAKKVYKYSMDKNLSLRESAYQMALINLTALSK